MIWIEADGDDLKFKIDNPGIENLLGASSIKMDAGMAIKKMARAERCKMAAQEFRASKLKLPPALCFLQVVYLWVAKFRGAGPGRATIAPVFHHHLHHFPRFSLCDV